MSQVHGPGFADWVPKPCALTPVVKPKNDAVSYLKGHFMKNITATIAILAATSAHAADYTCNDNGAVVTMPDGEVYYLGKDCDAVRKGGGTGKWWLTASAYAVDTDGQAFLLPFEIDCPALPACWYDS